MRRAVALAAALAALLPAAAEAREVRAFAVGPKFDTSWVAGRTTYRAHLLGLVDRAKRGPDVQAEADDVASHLRADGRNLVAFPEDLGLMAIFTGSRGERARASGGVVEAIANVLAAYGPQTAYYGSRFPALADRGLPTRLLAVAATDTFARVAIETYAEIAKTYGVWVEGGVNMAQSWRVVCQSRATMPELPGGERCAEESPAKVATLQTTDEPDRTYAYEATTPDASNMALLFDPQGRLVSKQAKQYLTPIELPGQLDLKPGDVFTGLSAVRTPVGTLGFVTSKDAWMPDVTSRLDQLGVDLLIQPEFFVGDVISTEGPWAPDNIKGAGFSDVLRHPSMEAMVLPELTGNIFDLSADNQQQIAVKPRGATPRGRLLGQPVVPGWKLVGDWVAEDPAGTIAERRRTLGEIGAKLLPSSDVPCPTPAARGVCRGGQVEDVIFADVDVLREPRLQRRARRKLGRTPFSVNRPLAPARGRQRNVALAARGRLVVAAFEQGDEIVVARSQNGGRSFRRTARLGEGWWPAVAVGPRGQVWVAFSRGERAAAGDEAAVNGAAPVGDPFLGTHRVRVARSPDGGRTFSPDVAAAGGTGAQLRPAIAATGADEAYVAFVAGRSRLQGDDLPQAGLWGVRISGGDRGAPARVDSTAAPNDLAATLDHAWAPSIAARGDRLELTWIDFRDYEWNVYARSSADGGRTWGTERLVNDTPDSDEALEDTPRPALLGDSPLVAYTDWAKSADSATTASPLYGISVAGGLGPERQIDAQGARHVSAFAPAVAARGRTAIVAWQDHRRGPADILASQVNMAGSRRPVRVDDSGHRGWNQWRPALAISGRSVIAAWEDERDGPPQIFVARARLGRIR